MKDLSIKAIFPGPKTSIPSPDGKVFPYLLAGMEINRANQVWAVDITYIKLPCGTVYLFALIDWYSRFIVSYKLVNTMEACHGVDTIEAALTKATPEICNADQGSQFTGNLWIAKLQAHKIQISHDGVGRCIDNVRIERFWRTIKYEDVFIQSYETLPEARSGIDKFIKHYNYQRPHQALHYKTPSDLYTTSKEGALAASPLGYLRTKIF
jgi:putative transposase